MRPKNYCPMEKPISIGTGKFRSNNNNNYNHVWFVVPLFLLLCFVALCFDYSSLFADTDDGGLSFLDKPQISVPGVFSNEANFNRLLNNPHRESSCFGRYIYAHDLPSRFNRDFIEKCYLITRGTEKDICPYVENFGFGHVIKNYEDVLLKQSWFTTNQFMLEVIFHNRMMNYRCLTKDSSLASAIYVPFYAGLDMSRYLWGYNISVRDSSSLELMSWLVKQKEWSRMSGKDHFLVSGRIAWDFRRQTDNESDWGSKLRFLPESRNMSMLAIESSSWNNDYAIPYPTCFHPSSVEEIVEWQERMRSRKRKYLFAFAGAPRPEYKDSVRGKIIDECLESDNQCYLLDCNYGKVNCDNPVNVMKVFRNSVFCLQPPGDSYTRRSIFDSILAGCIPVFFHPGTAYAQYKWHLPKNHKSYSVYLPVKDVKEWDIKIKERLIKIPEAEVASLREEVIKLIPSVLYVDPKNGLDGIEDAFELALKGMLEKIEQVRELIRQGKDGSGGFDDSDDYKYTFSPYESHVWD